MEVNSEETVQVILYMRFETCEGPLHTGIYNILFTIHHLCSFLFRGPFSQGQVFVSQLQFVLSQDFDFVNQNL